MARDKADGGGEQAGSGRYERTTGGECGEKRNAERGQEKSGDGKEAEQFKFAEGKVG